MHDCVSFPFGEEQQLGPGCKLQIGPPLMAEEEFRGMSPPALLLRVLVRVPVVVVASPAAAPAAWPAKGW
jgi:hypothetical protein